MCEGMCVCMCVFFVFDPMYVHVDVCVCMHTAYTPKLRVNTWTGGEVSLRFVWPTGVRFV